MTHSLIGGFEECVCITREDIRLDPVYVTFCCLMNARGRQLSLVTLISVTLQRDCLNIFYGAVGSSQFKVRRRASISLFKE